MQKNLTARTVIIVVTILLCIFGIIGIPKSKADLVENLKNNIRLGLDLKGGSHLVLEVQVQDAIKARCRPDHGAAQGGPEEAEHRLGEHGPQRSAVGGATPTTSIVTIKGMPATQSSDFRNLVNERYPHLRADGVEFDRLFACA